MVRSSAWFVLILGCAAEPSSSGPPSASIDPSTADFAGDFTGAASVTARTGATAAMATVHIDDDGAGGDGMIIVHVAPSCALLAHWRGRMFTSIVSSIAEIDADQACALTLDNGDTAFDVTLGSMTITTTGVLELKVTGQASLFAGSPTSGAIVYELFGQPG
jgi:hypothetical protein